MHWPRRGLEMNYNQNHKLSQITPSTLIVGIGIAKDKHVARAQDDWLLGKIDTTLSQRRIFLLTRSSLFVVLVILWRLGMILHGIFKSACFISLLLNMYNWGEKDGICHKTDCLCNKRKVLSIYTTCWRSQWNIRGYYENILILLENIIERPSDSVDNISPCNLKNEKRVFSKVQWTYEKTLLIHLNVNSEFDSY